MLLVSTGRSRSNGFRERRVGAVTKQPIKAPIETRQGHREVGSKTGSPGVAECARHNDILRAMEAMGLQN
jgi:hypothetical protein